MSAPASARSPRAGAVASPELFLLAVAALAMAWFAVVPTLRRAADAELVERTARELRRCDEASAQIVRRDKNVHERADVTPELVETLLRKEGRPPISWPEGVVPGTLDLAPESGPTVRVRLRSGAERTVTLADLDVDHAN